MFRAYIFISSLRIRVMMRISGFVLRRWTRRFMFKVRRMPTRRSSRPQWAELQV